MRITSDDAFLADLGLSEPPEHEREQFLQHVRGTLEERVGSVLAEDITSDELTEFEKLIGGERFHDEVDA